MQYIVVSLRLFPLRCNNAIFQSNMKLLLTHLFLYKFRSKSSFKVLSALMSNSFGIVSSTQILKTAIFMMVVVVESIRWRDVHTEIYRNRCSCYRSSNVFDDIML